MDKEEYRTGLKEKRAFAILASFSLLTLCAQKLLPYTQLANHQPLQPKPPSSLFLF
jgi:hypothetical protein